MEQNFFAGYDTPDKIKKRYFDLSKKFHPDMGGNQTLFTEMNRQYQIVLQALGQKARREHKAELAMSYARLLADGISIFSPKIAKFIKDGKSVDTINQCNEVLKMLCTEKGDEASGILQGLGQVCNFIANVQTNMKH